jgi:hypothetical protein
MDDAVDEKHTNAAALRCSSSPSLLGFSCALLSSANPSTISNPNRRQNCSRFWKYLRSGGVGGSVISAPQ